MWAHAQYAEHAPRRKSPQGGPHLSQKKKKKEREKEKEKKRKKNNHNKKGSADKKMFLLRQMGHFCRQCPAKQRQQAKPINPR